MEGLATVLEESKEAGGCWGVTNPEADAVRRSKTMAVGLFIVSSIFYERDRLKENRGIWLERNTLVLGTDSLAHDKS